MYLDHNATTPLDPRVLETMLPWLRHRFGNASSREHAYGWDAAEAVEEARAQVAESINAKPNEIVFTAGATEAIHIALHGLFPAGAAEAEAAGLIATGVEHDALRSACRRLAKNGTRVETVGVDNMGRLDMEAVAEKLASRPARLVCVMAANNETGVRFPVRECAERAHAAGALLLTDAAQALGKVPLDAQADGFDLAAFSAHKLYGPKGAGALYLRGGNAAMGLEPMSGGSGQEGGLRPGTLDVPAIVGFGEACRLARLELAEEIPRLAALRDRLEAALLAAIPGSAVIGERGRRVPNTASVCVPRIEARALFRAMGDVAGSTRSACSCGSAGPSHVLASMGLSDDQAFATIRFSVGRFTTEAEVDQAAARAAAAWRGLSGG
jgi:cysteine desulfurase